MSKTHKIPDVGDLLSGVDGVSHFKHVTVGPATTNDLVVTTTGINVLFAVNQPIVVKGLWTTVSTPFTAAVTLDIGDTANLERFSGSATIAATTSGTVLVAATGLAVPYVYSAAQDITIDVEAAIPAAGVLEVYIEYAVLND